MISNAIYNRDYLCKLDEHFQSILRDKRPDLLTYMINNRGALPDGFEYSQWLVETACLLEDFLSELFELTTDSLQRCASNLALVYSCNDRFIRKRALHAYSPADIATIDGWKIRNAIEDKLGGQWNEVAFAKLALDCLEREGDSSNDELTAVMMCYAAWAVYSEEGKLLHKNDIIFLVPAKKSDRLPEHYSKCGSLITSDRIKYRDGFKLMDKSAMEGNLSFYHSAYCLYCHKRGKDSCSRGLNEQLSGCALKEKISEMNYLHSRGLMIAALAVVVVDNPMCAGTGHRICNDCSSACIYQKQDPVDVPLIETNVLHTVLAMQYGFEIYSLLTRWNPLNLLNPLPHALKQGRVLIVGMGPAGYTMAHYLLNSGYTVVGVDGVKIEPLPVELAGYHDKGKRVGFRLIKNVNEELFEELDERVPAGFGGVAEYGITVRWNKNYLKIIRLLLERRDNFAMFDGIMLGGNLDFKDAMVDFDHVVIACGAGKPKSLEIPHALAAGMRYASDFLMNLHLGCAYKKDSINNLQLRSPIVVIGGGLTALDAATEALAYYSEQIKKFRTRYEILSELGYNFNWKVEDVEIVEEFLSDRTPEVTILYRGAMLDSPAYRKNKVELLHTLDLGVKFLEHAQISDINVDRRGHIASLSLIVCDQRMNIEARSMIVAIGTEKNFIFANSEYCNANNDSFLFSDSGVFCNVNKTVSIVGDLHTKYSGSVVRAMASAKDNFAEIARAIDEISFARNNDLFVKLSEEWIPRIKGIEILAPGIVQITVVAPLAARGFKPGQFYKLQNYENYAQKSSHPMPTTLAMEAIALTGGVVNDDTVSLVVLETGGSSNLCRYMMPGERVYLMGPTGAPTDLPANENVMLVGGGLGNIAFMAIGQALKANGCNVTYFAGYRKLQDRVMIEDIEAACDEVIWVCDEGALSCHRPRDQHFVGNIVDAIHSWGGDHKLINRLIIIGSSEMMCAVRERCANLFSDDCIMLASVNAPMQCMMKGLCGQCAQIVDDKQIFICCNQDQNLIKFDFSVLRARLSNNAVSEGLCVMWLKEVLRYLR